VKLIFVAGPYSNGDVAQNVKLAITWADKLMSAGFAVFVPHLSHFQHMVHARPYEDWTANDNAILRRCDAVFRIAGESHGADAEMALAAKLGIPVFDALVDLLEWEP
jgi:hypothetical protein